MQFLKSLVIGLGLLIVVGLGLLGWGFYHKAHDPAWRMFGAAPGKETAAASFGTVGLDLPVDCFIEQVEPDGDRLYLTVGPEEPACARVIVFDVARGRILGVIKPGK
ncbi:MAG TPA: hypothetical protein VGA19_09885 [Rhodospirillales bacterium]|jgi:hypothetical protein